MKKLFLLVIVAVASIANAQVGNFKIGGNVALPVGDLGDVFSFSLGVDVAYTLNVAPNLDLGVTTGYQNYFGKTIDVPKTGIAGLDQLIQKSVKVSNAGIIPLAAQVKYSVAPQFFIGTDLGAAFNTEKDGGTSFYYQPRVGYQVNQHEIALGYRGFSRNGQGSGAVSLGYAYNF